MSLLYDQQILTHSIFFIFLILIVFVTNFGFDIEETTRAHTFVTMLTETR